MGGDSHIGGFLNILDENQPSAANNNNNDYDDVNNRVSPQLLKLGTTIIWPNQSETEGGANQIRL